MKFCERPYRYIYTDGYDEPGTVLMCQWMKNSPARVIGNILEDDLYNIWHGERAEKLRKSFEDQSFCYCEKMSCPYLENDSLSDVSEEEFKKRSVVKEYPDQFNLAHDLTCNHKCPSCRNEIFYGGEQYASKMYAINEKLIPYLNKAVTISGCGLGDVFSSPYMMNLFSTLQPENKNVHITFETNGVLCDEEHWAKLSNLEGCTNITIGITPNSFDRSVYKYLSGGHDDLKRVINNLHFIRTLRDQGKIRSFYITIVVQESNFRELPGFVDKALNEFGATAVVIRTIYKWNKLSAEDYWFKDVMNPLHPYHRDMLEVMQNSILKDKRVYNWTNFNEHPQNVHPAFRYKEFLKMTKTIIEDEHNGLGLVARLKEKEINDVILYGANDLADIITDILKNKEFPVKNRMARDICSCDAKPEIISINDYIPDDSDCILITNYMDERYVRRDLIAKGVNGIIVSVDELYPNKG